MRIVHVIAAFFVLIATPAFAKGGPASWIVAQKSGDVRVIRTGVQPASLEVRAALSPGDVIATGANGRAMLTRGDDYVVVAPGSRLLLPKEQEQRGFTRLLQQVGTMFYKVKHTGVPHFAVQTPMLAAVVKGTSFSVVVDNDRAAVQVTDGVVEVSSLSGDAKRLVEKGLTVYIGRERPNEIIELKPGATVPPAGTSTSSAVKVERSGDVPVSTVVNLTDGLVKEAPVTVATNTVTADVVKPATGVAPLPAAEPVKAAVPGVTAPVVGSVDATVPGVADPLVGVVDTSAPALVEPVVDVVGTTAPAIVAPVVDVVTTTVPAVVEPVVDVVQTTVPAVVEPVVEIVTVVPAVVAPVVAPVVDVVQTAVPAVTPVVDVVTTTVPAVVAPVVDVVTTTVPAVTGTVGGTLGGLTGGLFGKP